MRIECSSEFKHLGKIANRLVSNSGKANEFLRDATLQIDAQVILVLVFQQVQ